MKRYRVYYPNGTHEIEAAGYAHAGEIAMWRWGAAPTLIEEIKED